MEVWRGGQESSQARRKVTLLVSFVFLWWFQRPATSGTRASQKCECTHTHTHTPSWPFILMFLADLGRLSTYFPEMVEGEKKKVRGLSNRKSFRYRSTYLIMGVWVESSSVQTWYIHLSSLPCCTGCLATWPFPTCFQSLDPSTSHRNIRCSNITRGRATKRTSQGLFKIALKTLGGIRAKTGTWKRPTFQLFQTPQSESRTFLSFVSRNSL